MRRSLLLVTAALALAAPPAIAAPKPAPPSSTDTLRLSLEEARERALATSPEARMVYATVKVAEGQVREATADVLPQLYGAVTYNHKFDSVFSGAAGDTSLGALGDLFSKSSFAAVHGWTADLTVSQRIWSGKILAGIAATRSVRDLTFANRDESLADIALDAHASYLNVLYAQAVETIAADGLAQAREHLKQVTLFHDQGSRSEYDLLQAQVDVANQEPALVTAKNAVEQTTLRLRQRLSLPERQPLVLTTVLAFEEGQVPVLAAEPGDGSGRAALRGADALVEARKQGLSAEKWSRWPELVAYATVSHQAYPEQAWPVSREEFGRAIDGSIRLQWPLFQGFRTFGTVAAATAELQRAEAARVQALQNVTLQAQQSRQELGRALATLVARRGTAKLATRAHHLATVRWTNGLSTQLEVSDARLQMQIAEVNEVAALKDYRLALLTLERATGAPLTLTYRSLDDLSSTLPDGDR